MKMDFHVHTDEVSPCGKVPAREMVRLYKAAGYDAIVITDHLYTGLKTVAECKTPAEKAQLWLTGYQTAKDEGDKIGLKVILGAELRQDVYGSEDFLAYGLKEEDIEGIFDMLARTQTVAEMSQYVRGKGMFLVQAHPFRPGLRAQDSALLDGVEIYNGNPRHNSSNHLAREMALDGGFALISGSDAHQTEDVGRGGMEVPDGIGDSVALARWLHENAPRTEKVFDEIAMQAV